MCGIVGYVGQKRVVPVIIEGLRRLEYRGYDSAGIAVAGNGDGLQIRRAEGKLRNLEEAIRIKPLDGTYGIGHTRWATHGRPTEENAHPHRDCSGRIVVVHNGIIENYVSLKRKLQDQGHRFTTETDTEVIAHLVENYFLKTGNGHRPSLEEAVRQTVKLLTGVFALAVIAVDEPNKIVAARNGPPAVIGLGNNEFFVASDVPAILYHTRDLFFLADGDLAVITRDGVQLTDFEGHKLERQAQHVTWDPIMAEKGGFKHFMLKEIYEQPRAVRDTTLGRVSQETGHVFLDEMQISEAEFKSAKKINIAACGTSWHAGQVGKFMIERLARLQGQKIEDIGHLQRCGLDDYARSRRNDLHPRGTRDRGGIDQGVYRTVDGALSACVAFGAGAGNAERRAIAHCHAGADAHSWQAGTFVDTG